MKEPKINNFREVDGIDSAVHLVTDDQKRGYAGFENKKDLYQFLSGHLGLCSIHNKSPLINHEIETTIKSVIENVQLTIIPKQDIQIYVFPTQDVFVQQEMKGVSGFCPYQYVIHLFISEGGCDSYQLAQTIAHEFHHSVRRSSIQRETLADSLIFEGMADSFTCQMYPDSLPVYLQNIDDQKMSQLWAIVQQQLDRNDLHDQLFFGNDADFQKRDGYKLSYRLRNKLYKDKKPDRNKLITKPTDYFINKYLISSL